MIEPTLYYTGIFPNSDDMIFTEYPFIKQPRRLVIQLDVARFANLSGLSYVLPLQLGYRPFQQHSS